MKRAEEKGDDVERTGRERERGVGSDSTLIVDSLLICRFLV